MKNKVKTILVLMFFSVVSTFGTAFAVLPPSINAIHDSSLTHTSSGNSDYYEIPISRIRQSVSIPYRFTNQYYTFIQAGVVGNETNYGLGSDRDIYLAIPTTLNVGETIRFVVKGQTNSARREESLRNVLVKVVDDLSPVKITEYKAGSGFPEEVYIGDINRPRTYKIDGGQHDITVRSSINGAETTKRFTGSDTVELRLPETARINETFVVKIVAQHTPGTLILNTPTPTEKTITVKVVENLPKISINEDKAGSGFSEEVYIGDINRPRIYKINGGQHDITVRSSINGAETTKRFTGSDTVELKLPETAQINETFVVKIAALYTPGDQILNIPTPTEKTITVKVVENLPKISIDKDGELGFPSKIELSNIGTDGNYVIRGPDAIKVQYGVKSINGVSSDLELTSKTFSNGGTNIALNLPKTVKANDVVQFVIKAEYTDAVIANTVEPTERLITVTVVNGPISITEVSGLPAKVSIGDIKKNHAYYTYKINGGSPNIEVSCSVNGMKIPLDKKDDGVYGFRLPKIIGIEKVKAGNLCCVRGDNLCVKLQARYTEATANDSSSEKTFNVEVISNMEARNAKKSVANVIEAANEKK